MSSDDHVLILVKIEGSGNIKFLRSYISTGESFALIPHATEKGIFIQVNIPENAIQQNITDTCDMDGLLNCINIDPNKGEIKEANGIILTTVKNYITDAKTYIMKKNEDTISINEDDIKGELILYSYAPITIETKSQKMFNTFYIFIRGRPNVVIDSFDIFSPYK